MIYYIYKTTHIPSGKYYIGKHQAISLNNDYLGSGIYIQKALQSCSKEQFQKEILQTCNSQEELNELEKILIADSYSDPLNMNFAYGGSGGPVLTAMKEADPERYEAYRLSQKQKALENWKNESFQKKQRQGLLDFWEQYKKDIDPKVWKKECSARSQRMKETQKNLKNNPEKHKRAKEKQKESARKTREAWKENDPEGYALSQKLRQAKSVASRKANKERLELGL